MLSPNIQDELRIRFKYISTPLVENNADGEAIRVHMLSNANIIANSFLQEAAILQSKTIMAYAGFLSAMGVTTESNTPATKFMGKLLAKESKEN